MASKIALGVVQALILVAAGIDAGLATIIVAVIGGVFLIANTVTMFMLTKRFDERKNSKRRRGSHGNSSADPSGGTLRDIAKSDSEK